MIRINIAAHTNGSVQALRAVEAAMVPARLDPVVARVAAETLRSVVEHTPKKWFGDLRRQWQMGRTAPARWSVYNGSKVMLFLEAGTANAGTGRIYPKVKKVLYVPLTRRAALGWNAGLKYGTDYILRRSVKGITPRWIVRDERVRAEARLLAHAKAHIKAAVASVTTS